ncbi:MAG TPA: (Fe-S)-binding protein, partial [Burkholderiaceae bacterium]|nr:(Fe-S)-binding protein [Burkholderiaceae bacterium]
DLGFQDDALQLANSHAQLVRQSGASVLLSACAEAYAAFRNHYPRMGVALAGVRVVHSTDFLDELLHSGKLSLSVSNALTVTYHDPCRLGRLSEPFKPWKGEWITVMNTMLASDSPRPVRFGNDGNYEAPRRLLGRVQGLELVEMERNRQFAYCCGAGAAAPQAYPKMADMAAINRLREAEATGASCVVTACAGCQRHLADAARAHGMAIEVRSVLDLLAGTNEPEGRNANLALSPN